MLFAVERRLSFFTVHWAPVSDVRIIEIFFLKSYWIWHHLMQFWVLIPNISFILSKSQFISLILWKYWCILWTFLLWSKYFYNLSVLSIFFLLFEVIFWKSMQNCIDPYIPLFGVKFLWPSYRGIWRPKTWFWGCLSNNWPKLDFNQLFLCISNWEGSFLHQ